jgi:hypothetical protein
MITKMRIPTNTISNMTKTMVKIDLKTMMITEKMMV